MFKIKAMGIKLYGNDGILKSNGWSNLVIIPKIKIENGNCNIEASYLYGMYFKVSQYKDGYKTSKNPIQLNI